MGHLFRNGLNIFTVGDKTITVKDGDKYEMSTIDCGVGLQDVLFDPVVSRDRLLIGTVSGTILVYNATTLEKITTITGFSGTVRGLVYDPINDRFVTHETNGKVTAFDANTYVKGPSITFSGNAGYSSVDPDTNRLFIPNWNGNLLQVHDLTTLSLITSFPAYGAIGSYFDKPRNRLFVSDQRTAGVFVYNATTYEYITKLSTLLRPYGISARNDRDSLLLSNNTAAPIYELDLPSLTFKTYATHVGASRGVSYDYNVTRTRFAIASNSNNFCYMYTLIAR
jgi:hypothetical protein